MYINLHIYQKRNLRVGDVEKLTFLKQNSAGKNEQYLQDNLTDDDISRYKELKYIKEVKASKKGDSVYKLLRTTDIANKLLVELSFASDYTRDSEILIDWMIQTYRKRGGNVKNRTESLRRLSWFEKITTIEKNELANMILCFINDTYVSDNPNFMEGYYEAKKDNPRIVLSQLIDNVFYKPESIQDKHYTLDKSPLYNYYTEHKEFVDSEYQKYLTNEKETS